jgi:hypothetical protein
MIMRVKSLSWIQAILFGCAATFLTSCNDSEEPMGKGEVEFHITDAPIDDANVKSVVVTVSDLKIDGQSVSGFTKTTLDLKAFQDGNTKILGGQTMDAKAYSSMVLVLDLDTDAQGNAPGCYVLGADGAKYKLKNTTSGKLEVVANQSWNAVKNTKTVVVADFDLRKSIRYSDDPAIRYSFVSDASLNSAVRIVAKEKSGTIKGTYENSSDANPEKIIVYAYKKGTFNAATETQAQGTDGIQFKNAVGSALIKESLSGQVYTLAYLPEGEYELVFAGYSKNSDSGRVAFEALLKSETNVNGSVSSIIKVQANATISISTSIKGLI